MRLWLKLSAWHRLTEENAVQEKSSAYSISFCYLHQKIRCASSGENLSPDPNLFLLLIFQSTASSAEEYKSSGAMRAHTALKAEEAEVDGQEVCFTPLPTPEEKMRQQAQAILTDIVPINVTGKNHSLIMSDRGANIYRCGLGCNQFIKHQTVKCAKGSDHSEFMIFPFQDKFISRLNKYFTRF